MKKDILYIIIICLISTNWAYAQNVKVFGIVTSSDNGNPLSNVSVNVKGTTIHATTNTIGKYEIIANKSDILVFQYPGTIPQEIPATNKNINVALTYEDNTLEETIVVAYTTANKASYTGSVSVVRKGAIGKSQASSISKVLQGNAAGVQSTSSSGQPGENAFLLIRGVGSVSAATVPLYIVDGVPYSGDINAINPSEIESITVLKDAASNVLYGSRGANGVIIITSKQGRKGQAPRVDIKLTYGFSERATADYKQVSTNEYFTMYWEALYNQQLYGSGSNQINAAQFATNNLVSRLGINPYGSAYPYPVGTDGKLASGATPLWNDSWLEAYGQEASRFETFVSLSGSSQSTTYFASFGYLNDQGIAIGSGFKRYSGRLNLNSDIKSWLRFSGNISLAHSVQDYPASEGSGLDNIISSPRLIPSFYPVWERNRTTGEFVLDASGNKIYDFGSYRPNPASPNTNLAASTPLDLNIRKRDVASIRTSLEVVLLEGLSFKSNFSIDYTNQNNHSYINPLYGSGSENGGSVSKLASRLTGVTSSNLLFYNANFSSKHKVKTFVGQEYYEYHHEYINGNRTNLVLPYLDEPNSGAVLGNFSGYSDEYKLLSFFGNAEYGYNNKYFVSASLRTDGSSRFHPNNRWGTFWSMGSSWRIINERFMKFVPWISNMTLRASYGAQGNDNLNTFYAYKPLYEVIPSLGESGIISHSLETSNLKWESNLNLNIGLDVGLFKNRFSTTFEFFHRKSKDLLFSVPKAPSIGHSEMNANVGSVRNIGFELAVNSSPIKTEKWKWSLFANLTHYKNKMTSLPQKEIISASGYMRMVVGGSIYDFFLAEWGGIDPSDGLPQWYKTENNGSRALTKDFSEANTPESKINAGTSLPDFFGGFGTNLQYKNIELSCLFAYSVGGQIYNGDKLSMMHNGNYTGRAWSKDMLNRWTPENTNTDIPRLQTTNTYWTSMSTRFLVDATYLRLKNIMLCYNIPKRWLSKIHTSDCKIFIQGENLLTFFGEKGLDPEQTPDGWTNYRYPTMKTFSFGFNFSF